MEKQNFYDLNFDQLKSFLIEKGEVEPKKAKMRSQQLFNAVYKKNIKKVYFDRGIFKYHGRVKLFADTLRKNGMEF